MSIRNKRLVELTENILRTELQNGNLPSSKEFIWKLNMALKEQDLNMPSYKFKPYRNTEIASSQKINSANEKIQEDLSILYSNIKDVHQTLNKYYSAFEVEKEKIDKQIEVLENELKEKVISYNKGGYLGYAFDAFDDTSKTSLDASKDVFVDSKNHEVRLVEEKNTSTRIMPSTSISFHLLQEFKEKKETTISGNLSDILKDETDIFWQRMIYLKEDLAIQSFVQITFDKLYDVNRIQTDFMTIKPFYLKIEFTKDGSAWYDLPYYEQKSLCNGTSSFNFPTMEIKAIRVFIEKTESDEQIPETEKFDYSYLFGIKNISFYNKQYPTSGVFQSEKMQLISIPKNYKVDNVRLSVDEYVPTGTSLTYEIAVPRKDNILDWQRIDPMERINPKNPQKISFSNIKKNEALEMFFPTEFSITQSEAEDLRVNGIPFYRLSTITGDKREMLIQKKAIIEGTMRLYSGKNSWEITSFPDENISGTPSIEDWKKIHDNTSIEYIEMNNTKSGDVMKNYITDKNKKFMCKTGLFRQGEDIIVKTYPVSTDPIALYVNGELLFEGITSTDEYVNIVLQNGWNEIVLFINGVNSTSVNGISTSLGFNPINLAENIYSSSNAMKAIPLFDLRYNTKMNDRTVFSTRETDKGIEILTNFGQPGMKFDFIFNYVDESVLEEEAQILLKVNFDRENGSNVPSPVLNKYRLEFN